MRYEWDQTVAKWRDRDTGTLIETISMNTTALLIERGSSHGSFADNAKNGQTLREFFRSSPQWHAMPDVHREALDMAATKLSRILSGQSRFRDHWLDLAGYATLALEACDE